MFFSFCDSVCSNCLHPFSGISHIFFIVRLISASVYPSSQTLLITWQWMTSPSRSSCWPLVWPQPESAAALRLQLLCGAATLVQRYLWCSQCCCCFATTDPCTYTPLPPVSLRIQYNLWNMHNLFWALVYSFVAYQMKHEQPHSSLYLSWQELVLLYLRSLDIVNGPVEAHQLNIMYITNRFTPTVLVVAPVPSWLTSSLLRLWCRPVHIQDEEWCGKLSHNRAG